MKIGSKIILISMVLILCTNALLNAQTEIYEENLPENINIGEAQELVEDAMVFFNTTVEKVLGQPDPIDELLRAFEEENKAQIENAIRLLEEDDTGLWTAYQEEMKRLDEEKPSAEKLVELEGRMVEKYGRFFNEIAERAELNFASLSEYFVTINNDHRSAFSANRLDNGDIARIETMYEAVFNPVVGAYLKNTTPNTDKEIPNNPKPIKENSEPENTTESFVITPGEYSFATKIQNISGSGKAKRQKVSVSGKTDNIATVTPLLGFSKVISTVGQVISVPAGVKEVKVQVRAKLDDYARVRANLGYGNVKSYRTISIKGPNVKVQETFPMGFAYAVAWWTARYTKEEYFLYETTFRPASSGGTYILNWGTIAEGHFGAAIGNTMTEAKSSLDKVYITYKR